MLRAFYSFLFLLGTTTAAQAQPDDIIRIANGVLDSTQHSTLGLTPAPGTETITIFHPTDSDDHYANGVVMTAFKDALYCMWQSSDKDEDSPDTWVACSRSSDNGQTWSKLQLIDTPNNNSGLDAVTLSDGSFAMICNDWPIEPTKEKGARTPLSILRSSDGIHWSHWITLEDSPISQYSYPSIIQTRDGRLHAIYTWRRQRIKHVELEVK